MDNLRTGTRHTAAVNVSRCWSTRRSSAVQDVALPDETYGCWTRPAASGRGVRLFDATYCCWTRYVRLLDGRSTAAERKTYHCRTRDVRRMCEMYGFWKRRTTAGRGVRLLDAAYGCWTTCTASGQDVRLLNGIGTAAADKTHSRLLWTGDVRLLWITDVRMLWTKQTRSVEGDPY